MHRLTEGDVGSWGSSGHIESHASESSQSEVKPHAHQSSVRSCPQGLGCRNSQVLLLQEGKAGSGSPRAGIVFQERVSTETVKGLKGE